MTCPRMLDIAIEQQLDKKYGIPIEDIVDEMEHARLYLRKKDIFIDSLVMVESPNFLEPVIYLGLTTTEHGVVAVVRIQGDILAEAHYSRLVLV